MLMKKNDHYANCPYIPPVMVPRKVKTIHGANQMTTDVQPWPCNSDCALFEVVNYSHGNRKIKLHCTGRKIDVNDDE